MPQKVPFEMLGVQICLRTVGTREFAVLIFDRRYLAGGARRNPTVEI